jgi:glycine C-acetyltransferase
MVDDSHASGFIGARPGGTPEFRDVIGRVDDRHEHARQGARRRGRRLHRSARREIVGWLRQRSRPYLFSNSVPPVIAATALRALDLIESGDELARGCIDNTAHFRARMTAADSRSSRASIRSHRDARRRRARRAFRRAAAELGVYVIGFSYPVVPLGKAPASDADVRRAHAQQLDRAIDSFIKVGRELGIIA